MAKGICVGGYENYESFERWGTHYQVLGIETIGIGDPPLADDAVCGIEDWASVPPAAGATHAKTCQFPDCGRILQCQASKT